VSPLYIAVDGSGNVFIDYEGGTWEEKSSGPNFGLVDVASPSSPIFYTAGTIGKPAVVTQGGRGWISRIRA
jgi:hypothetical protein